MSHTVPHARTDRARVPNRRSAQAAIFSVVLGLSACFPNRALEPHQLRTIYPTEFRLAVPTVVLVRSGASGARAVAGVTHVYGVLASITADTATVTAARITINGRDMMLRSEEVVHVPIADGAIASAHQQRFSGKRTFALVGGVAATLLLALVLVFAILWGSDDS